MPTHLNTPNEIVSLPRLARNTIRALALVLAVSNLPLLAADEARAQRISQQQALQAYDNFRYGYCDAKKVAAVWNRSIFNSKVIIGEKVVAGAANLINQDIANTNGRVFCSWEETDLSYNDAVRLANIWAVQPHEAKVKAERWVSQLGTRKFRAQMGI